MFSTDDGPGSNPVAWINEGKSKGEILFLREEPKNPKSILKYEPVTEVSVFDGQFEVLPNDPVRVIYVAGPSGSGKSTFCAKYIENFRNIYPKSKFYLFSRLKDDEPLDDLEPHRINLDDPELIENPIQIEEVEENSIILFDDIDTISNKPLLDSLINFENQVLELGRHRSVKILITSHLINGNNRKQTRTILNEMQALVIFPKSGSVYQMKYTLKQYLGMSNVQINKSLAINSRWLYIQKIYPQILVSEHLCIFLSDL